MCLMAAQGNNYCEINPKRREASAFQEMNLNTHILFMCRENRGILWNCGKQIFSFILSEIK